MINNVNLADIRSFVLIAQLGNFTKAANALSVSRSHVSRQISSLETQMGVTLLTRTTRTLKLTQAGERFFKQCESALKEIDQALVAAVDDTEDVRGIIRVNCVGGLIGEDIIAVYVSEFMATYPDIQVHLDFTSHRVDLIDDDFDVAFRMGDLQDAGFIARKLLNVEIVTLASPQYLAKTGSPIHPKELIEHRCLTGSVNRWSFQSKESNSDEIDVTVEGHLVCKNGRALIQGALLGNGIIRVPAMYCQDMIDAGKLVPVLTEWRIPRIPLSAIYHKDKYQPKRLRTFIEFIKNKFDAA
ncbi:LysR family transcriptional regulator [Vibrio nigripulchritudo]|uniref:LysR family transcriptional regulator n=1 Tax=Vibrio nigripulchritudo TaxID=28173 RepID=UPI002490D588|nr:LysR family transcriptional regulator [Vibrio nigripulchritudo]BDU37991.1 LysR family transcriptional regulator [Vibrio nigripulchritudo]BDU43713.1 LysR family transcriptional regulator [Vibrio nigripulchritudo]